MAEQDLNEQDKNKDHFINEVDETIESVCKKVQDSGLYSEDYIGAVNALASLISARALLK